MPENQRPWPIPLLSDEMGGGAGSSKRVPHPSADDEEGRLDYTLGLTVSGHEG